MEDYSEHPDYLDKLNWYFIPSANPDGYTYSWESDRMWRKTRSDYGSSLGCKVTTRAVNRTARNFTMHREGPYYFVH